MLAGVPLVHLTEDLRGLVDGEHGALRKNVQLPIRHDGGDLDDRLPLRVEPGHFQIDPDQTLELDQDSGLVAGLFDERADAVSLLLKMAIDACLKAGRSIGSLSLNPESVIQTWLFLPGETV